jgi:hypothetical protein
MFMELYPSPFYQFLAERYILKKKHFLKTATATCHMFYLKHDFFFLKAHYSDFLLLLLFFAKADFLLICGLSAHRSSLVPYIKDY